MPQVAEAAATCWDLGITATSAVFEVFHGAFFCSTLFLGALSDERPLETRPTHASGRLQTSGSRFSSVTDQLYIFLLTLLIVLQDVRPARLSFVLPVLYLAVAWRKKAPL